MPQPIDPLTELGRLTAAERIQQIAERASLAAQARSADSAINQSVAAESQVQSAFQKGAEVNEELRRKTPYIGRRKRKPGDAEDEQPHTFYTAEEKKNIAEDPGAHDLDVTV